MFWKNDEHVCDLKGDNRLLSREVLRVKIT